MRPVTIPHTFREASGWPTLEEHVALQRALDSALLYLEILSDDENSGVFRCERGAVIIRHTYGVGA